MYIIAPTFFPDCNNDEVRLDPDYAAFSPGGHKSKYTQKICNGSTINGVQK